MSAGRKLQCPVCARRIGLTPAGDLAGHHNHRGQRCRGSDRDPAPLPGHIDPRPITDVYLPDPQED